MCVWDLKNLDTPGHGYEYPDYLLGSDSSESDEYNIQRIE